jgi:hypothetical protein
MGPLSGWGGQFWRQPPFMAAGRAGKRFRYYKATGRLAEFHSLFPG